MSDSQTTLEGLITEAIDRFPGHDFILKRHHRDGIWTVAFGNNIEAFVAIGYGKKPREALDAMVPVTRGRSKGSRRAAINLTEVRLTRRDTHP